MYYRFSIIYEILRRAGLRVPKPLGHAVSIVGGLVIGESCRTVRFGRSSNINGYCANGHSSSYVVPSLYEQTAILRLIFIIIGGTLGFWGITLGFCAILISLCSESIYKIPFSAPLSPFNLKSMRDVARRASWKYFVKM